MSSSTRDADEEVAFRSSIAFRTAFERNAERFYFEYTETHDRFFDPSRAVVWQQARGPAHSWWTLRPEAIREGDLQSALHSFAGVSHRLSVLIPWLLLDHEGESFQLSYQLVGDETIQGVPAFKLSSALGARTVSLWIRQADYALIRYSDHDLITPSQASEFAKLPWGLPEAQVRAFEEARRRPFISDEVIEIHPAFDEPMDPKAFQFLPPTSALTGGGP